MQPETKSRQQLRNKTVSQRSRQFLTVTAVVFYLVSGCWAQLDRSGLTGTVTDPSGRVLPGVQVLAAQNETGLRRETVTSGSGTYDLPGLPVGRYTVTISLDNFQSLRFENVAQELGQTRTLNAALPVKGKQEQVEVSADPQSLDQTTNTLGVDIERKQAQELPLSGRNWAALTALVPGAVDTSRGPGSGNQRSILFAARGRDDNNYTYDGIDATNIINQPQQYYVRLAIPLDTIQEFRVDPMLATAETGGTGGGQLAVASPSGTNQFHGDAFEFARNSFFDATEPIDSLNPGHKPPFHLNQFGGSFGGPIVRDNTFFFVAYEGYRQDLDQTLHGYVPSLAFRNYVETVSPNLAPVLGAYPITGLTPYSKNPCVVPGTVTRCVDNFMGQGTQVGQEDSGMFRVDHRFSDATTIFARANIDSAILTVPYSPTSGQLLNETEQLTSSPVNSVIVLSHVFSPTLLNETKVGFNRSTADTTYFNQTGSLDAIAVAGFTTLNTGRASTGVGNSFAAIDEATWVHGRHALKAGIEIRFLQLNQGSSTYGTISYNNLLPSSTAPYNFADNTAYKASLTGAYPVNGLRKTQYFGFIQDEFKWRPNFTLNLGARYSFFNVFHEAHSGLGNPFDFATCGPQGYCGVGASFGQANYADIDPRVALAWLPATLGGKTVIRSSFGTYHEDGQLDDQNIPEKNIVPSYTLNPTNCPGLGYPLLVTASGSPEECNVTGTISPNAEQRRRKDTYVTQWGLSVQQALPANFIGTVSYVGSEGTHLLAVSYQNVYYAGTTQRIINPAYSQVPWRGTTGNSEFQGLSLSIRRTFFRGLLVSVNYMWSHEIDDGSNGSGDSQSVAPQNVDPQVNPCQPSGERRCGERASGDSDARHVVNANAVWELPFGPGKPYLSEPGAWRAIFGSWTFGTVFIARTGLPVNITDTGTGPDGNSNNQRPNLVPGQPLYLHGGNFNPAAFALPAVNPTTGFFATFGDVPRNFLRAPGVWQSDMSLSKHIPIHDQVQLQFRAEVFNVFNKALYAVPDGNISDSNFGSAKGPSPLNTTPIGMGTQRQFQFMLKVLF